MLQPSPSQRGYLIKYSNNADANLASGLEARSYQPKMPVTRLGGRIGTMVAEYIGISTHVIGVLRRWDQGSMYGIRDFIKSGLGDEKYSEVEQSLTEKIKDFEICV
ncbi:hypothetical protein BASA83_013312 [Batrachochytrium salamandrivorans]|nr:hypothetical protein BASA83_013312 [Batrachochytrium salamandrivorans]